MFTQWFLNERRHKCVIAGTGVDRSTHFQLEWGLYAVGSIPREPHIGHGQNLFFFIGTFAMAAWLRRTIMAMAHRQRVLVIWIP